MFSFSYSSSIESVVLASCLLMYHRLPLIRIHVNQPETCWTKQSRLARLCALGKPDTGLLWRKSEYEEAVGSQTYGVTSSWNDSHHSPVSPHISSEQSDTVNRKYSSLSPWFIGTQPEGSAAWASDRAKLLRNGAPAQAFAAHSFLELSLSV